MHAYIKKRSYKKILLIVILLSALAAGIVWVLSQKPAEPVRAEVVTYSTATPAEDRPGDDFEWRGSPSDPKHLALPSIGTEGYIQNVGIDQNQEVAVPSNIHFAGWFVDSVLPGDKGLSVIAGHLDGQVEDGIFTNLDKMEQGDVYTVAFGDGSRKQFKVIGVQIVDLDEAAGVLFSQDPTVSNQVNLITCGGNYNSSLRLYDKRVIVSSSYITSASY